jgi:hypothetical protein
LYILLFENLFRIPAERLREVGGRNSGILRLEEVEEALEGIRTVSTICFLLRRYLIYGLYYQQLNLHPVEQAYLAKSVGKKKGLEQ